MIDMHHGWNASLKPQFIGFIASVILIVATYHFVKHSELSNFALTATIFGSAIAQALIQLVFFMHLGFESKPHWNTITFFFTLLVIILIIGGSVWIMNNINYNLMPTMGH